MRLGNVDFSSVREKPSRVALLLAVAHEIQRHIEEGTLQDYAQAAAAMELSRREVTEIAALAQLSPAIQTVILSGGLSTAGRHLLAAAKWRVCWSEQEADLRHFFPRWDRNLSHEFRRGGERGDR